MGFTLDKVVPWGRSLDEYAAMFELTEGEMESRILGCADGPASFNAEMHEAGRRVVSVDPVYRFSVGQIRRRIEDTFVEIMDELRKNLDDYVWKRFPCAESLGRHRMRSMERFLGDFEKGKGEGRYVAEGLPDLPFGDGEFDLALCSHFLFLYSEQLSAEFHCRAIKEMCRVAVEARVFSLLTLDRRMSPHLKKVYEYLESVGLEFEVKTVEYEFQRGGNKMLRVWRGKG